MKGSLVGKILRKLTGSFYRFKARVEDKRDLAGRARIKPDIDPHPKAVAPEIRPTPQAP